ncbi:antibiotic biosynthesis monooxygenase [Rhizobium lusitanum]|uniref:Antibiotic biosynthesis monooxygenase n=1 Tax=Rhizobium lusitanum TaxID=293958 RepID=A0A6L9UL67_9HYPH|nr:putative quinol monooxygenase [Rhizobium lusitanum]NEI74590.1 antibiotic biosynthesis monooxygenase [Rhizobium lusitanum]
MTTPAVAIFVTKPGAEDKLEALFRSVIATTLTEEGCISYQLNRDLDNPRRFVWTEEWESRALLEKHAAAPHIKAILAEIPALVDSAEVIALRKLDGGPA